MQPQLFWSCNWQVNYLGPYMLTRLLEPCLVAAAPSRVINVSSVTHRYGCIDNPASFLSKSNKVVGGQYPVSVHHSNPFPSPVLATIGCYMSAVPQTCYFDGPQGFINEFSVLMQRMVLPARHR